ncbi:hypothetical protein QI031_03410 [Halotia branconii CENA392]|uniref:Uncharacterized protein n=2 Tax=Halotia TaxID=1620790 RepID=A0AAJ6NXR7_9CYAN|nr:hypothetical protein [Halotia branconii]WGV28699.1 hypothetical protein QI031_03410 [Halotia branconii CENA392]
MAFIQQAKKFYPSFLYGYNKIPYRLGLTLFIVAGLCSCSSLKMPSLKASNLSFGSNVTPIRQIKPQQGKQTTTTVYVEGKVEKRVPLVKQWAYQINDSTDKIWVVTNQSNLEEGARVVIKGKVHYKSIPLAGKEFGEVYIEEE